MSSIHSLAYRLRFNRVQSAAVGTQQRLTHPQCTGARQGNNTVHVINIVMPRWENETFDSESTHCYKMISGMTQSTLVHEVLKSVRSHLNGPGLWKSHYLEDQIISVFEFLIEFHKGGTSHNNVLEQLAGMGLTTRNDSKNLLLNSIFHAVFYSIICTQGLFCTPSLYSNLTALKKTKKKTWSMSQKYYMSSSRYSPVLYYLSESGSGLQSQSKSGKCVHFLVNLGGKTVVTVVQG